MVIMMLIKDSKIFEMSNFCNLVTIAIPYLPIIRQGNA